MLAEIRKDFPIFQHSEREGILLHYLDNAATTFRPRCVIEAVSEYYSCYPANVHRSMHPLSDRATDAFEATRDTVRQFINAKHREEIIFTTGTTSALNLVAHSFCCNLKSGDIVLTTEMEHHSNLIPWRIASERYGFSVQNIPVKDNGTFDLSLLEGMLNSRVKLVTITHMSNVLGITPPVEQIIRMAHTAGIPVCLDAAQSIAHVPLDVQNLDCDFLAFSGHKMFGPSGTGVLYARRKLLETMSPSQGGGDMINRVTPAGQTWADLPARFEAGTPNIAGVIGLQQAMHYIEKTGYEPIAAHTKSLTDKLIQQLNELSNVKIITNGAYNRHGIVSFTVKGIHPHDIAQFAAERGVAIRAGSLCAQPLLQRLKVPAVCRASLTLYNTQEDVIELIYAIRDAERFFNGS